MAKTQQHADPKKLRRINLDSQGLLKQEPFGRGSNATRRAIEQLGYVQIDTISVVERAHHHILRSRVPNYTASHLDRLQQRGEIFEHWYHAAAYLPMRDYRFALPLMEKMRRREERWIRSHDDKLMDRVLKFVADAGPTRARDLETPKRQAGSDADSGWWNWKPAKSALEQLFMQGDLMITGREGFEKVYDLRDRVLPDGVDTSTPTTGEMADYLIDTTLRAHGIASASCMTHGRIHAVYREDVKSRLLERMEEGQLYDVRLPGGATLYARTEIAAERAPSAPARVKVLSPFDNLVIQRPRGQMLFDFNYQIECYVPAAKRRFGYFCLPLLYGDRMIGRADCKAHREEGRFEVKALHIEAPADALPDPAQLVDALYCGIQEFAQFNNCPQLQFSATSPAHWRKLLRQADKTRN